ncbi:MAG: manganese efflux pump MntP family protein [Dorea sp.]
MNWNFLVFMNSALLGVGLAMDAFSVSLANGMNEKKLRKSRMAYIAGVYAFFQFLMPMVGWICVHTIVQIFSQFQKCIPWIALILLLYIGGSMIWESVKGEEEIEEVKKLSFAVLMLQGIATSIDALSVGFTIADYGFVMALVCSIIIAVVTFAICETGLYLGKTLGTKLAGKADVLGGVILIGIGIEIFVKGVFF